MPAPEKIGFITNDVIKTLNLSIKENTPIFLGQSNKVDHLPSAKSTHAV